MGIAAIVGCSPIESEAVHPDAVVLQPSDLGGDHWRLMPTGMWGGLAGAEATCEGGQQPGSATNEAFAKSDAFASTAISSDRLSSVGVFTMVLRLPTSHDAEEAERDFAASLEGEAWADCYAERLAQSFATELDVVAELSPPSLRRDGITATAATFDLEVATGLLYRSEMYTWRSGRLLVYVAFAGPASQLAAADVPGVVDALWVKSGR